MKPDACLLQADQGQIDEPRLRRHETLDLWAHCTRVEIVDDEKPGRIIDDALMRLAISGRNGFRIGRLGNRLERVLEFVVLPLLEIESVRRKIGSRKITRHDT